MKKILTIALFLGFGFAATAQDNGIVAKIMKGIASYYHPKFEGRKTANGETFSNSKFTCASNKIPLNTYVKVTNLNNGKVVYVKVNDRMAASNNRLLDMTQTAAAALDYREEGLAHVKMEIVTEEEGRNQVLAQREELKTANNRL